VRAAAFRNFLAYDFCMRCVLGFDGGGTKTDCVAAAETGELHGRGQGGPSNPFRIGFGAALASLRESAQLALAGGQFNAADVVAVCAGLAGVGQAGDAEKMRALLAAEFPQALTRICTDLDLLLAAAPAGPVIILVAGTGSAAIGRSASGEIVRVGGHGPMISDEGSAYDTGRRAVIAAQRDFDRTGKNTPLGERILREMGSVPWPELRKRIQSAPDEVFPRLFSVVAALADNGDQAAQDILRAGAYKLASIAATLAERLQLSETKFPLIKTGGMIGRSKYLDGQLHERLRVTLPNGEAKSLESSPAEAAARLALELLGTAKPVGRAR
jgi:N-acetylglucosamine kinase-like BadF-type ATPase